MALTPIFKPGDQVHVCRFEGDEPEISIDAVREVRVGALVLSGGDYVVPSYCHDDRAAAEEMVRQWLRVRIARLKATAEKWGVML